MNPSDAREYWQRGPVEGVPPLLQPIAHGLMQAVAEVERYTENFLTAYLWERPANVASVGFHLLHLRGVLDRLFTYAREEPLNEKQLQMLSAEQHPEPEADVRELVDAFRRQVHMCIEQLKSTQEATLLEVRTIGRKKIPTNTLGLLFHSVEHTQRHVGQLLVTARVVVAKRARENVSGQP